MTRQTKDKGVDMFNKLKWFFYMLHETALLYVVLIIVSVVSVLVYAEYEITKRALRDMLGKEPSTALVWYSVVHDARSIDMYKQKHERMKK